MHPCLRVDEIIRFLANELVELEAERTAVALACCCKTFEEPVLDVLWEGQDRLTPLLKCLPEDTWEVRGGFRFVSYPMAFAPSAVSHQIRKTFKRTPTEAEWANFRKYALRMRILELDASKDPQISDILLVQQSHTTNDPWLPRLTGFRCELVGKKLIPLIPFFLSPRTTDICIGFDKNTPAAVIGPMIMRLPTLCPDMNQIDIFPLPQRDPVITEVVSKMLLSCKRDHLRDFIVDSTLTEEARGVVFRLPKLSELRTVIEGRTLLPPVRLPNLTDIEIVFDDCFEWLQGLQGMDLEKLRSVFFYSKSREIGEFLGAFALTTLANDTLLHFHFSTSYAWNPNYRPLLRFTRLETLIVEFSCDWRCSSSVDDDILGELAEAMPRLEILQLGDPPCYVNTGVTIKGLTALAHNCRYLRELRIHFQTDSIAEAAESQETHSHSRHETATRENDCALISLEAGETPVSILGSSMVAKGLLQVFPRLRSIESALPLWRKIQRDIRFLQKASKANHQRSETPTVLLIPADDY